MDTADLQNFKLYEALASRCRATQLLWFDVLDFVEDNCLWFKLLLVAYIGVALMGFELWSVAHRGGRCTRAIFKQKKEIQVYL